jgi:hypothetical protein
MPDFTIQWKGKEYYWEHLGMLDVEEYAQDWGVKEQWYQRFFSDCLITTRETSTLSDETLNRIRDYFSG